MIKSSFDVVTMTVDERIQYWKELRYHRSERFES